MHMIISEILGQIHTENIQLKKISSNDVVYRLTEKISEIINKQIVNNVFIHKKRLDC